MSRGLLLRHKHQRAAALPEWHLLPAGQPDARRVPTSPPPPPPTVCVRKGKFDSAQWLASSQCDAGLRLPTADEYSSVASCITAADASDMSSGNNDIVTAVGGCGCTWNSAFCGSGSMDTMRAGRMCADRPQYFYCVA